MDTTPRDEHLWRLAKKRANFKRSLITYFIVNAFLWAIWLFTYDRHEDGWNGIPWPLWVSLGWGVGIVVQYFDAYSGNKEDLAEREYRKLKEKNHRL